MARPRSLPDTTIYAIVLALIAAHGERGVTFASVSQRSGLAGASLVQRYGSLEAMVKAALGWGWLRLGQALTLAEQNAEDRGAPALLKLVAEEIRDLPLAALIACSDRDAGLRALATDWRLRVEGSLSSRTDQPAMIFAAWMGQMLWESLGGKSFRLKEAAKKLG